MSEGKAKGWTDTEKVGILFQIIDKLGKIPWNELNLPEGRTLKAVQVMIDKEKAKIRKAANGEEVPTTPATPATPATGKKRGAKTDHGDEDGSVKKKAKTPRKNLKSINKQENGSGDDDEVAGVVKIESAGED